MNSVNIAALVLRLAVGGTMIAHGWNHAFGGGKLPGTARWFESIGIRPGRLHALFATVTELGAGALLVLGLLTPLAAAKPGLLPLRTGHLALPQPDGHPRRIKMQASSSSRR
jgi:uncharacterized membrane protein YphA (DoxX/SURF4 family)